MDMPRAEWLKLVADRPSPKSRALMRSDLECAVPPRYFTDYLTLLKLKDGWKIVSKTFRTTIR
jgi:hypothetical protein